MAARKPYPVEVRWVDACSNSGWQGEKAPENDESIECMSTGYLLSRTKREITLATNLNRLGHTGDWMTIPTSCVTRVRRLK